MKIKDNFLARNLEERYALVVMLFGILYFSFNLVIEINQGLSQLTTLIVAFLLLVSLSSFLLLWNGKLIVFSINCFVFILILSFFVLLIDSSGPHGSMGYNFQVLAVIAILLTNGRTKTIVSLILVLILIVMQSDLIPFISSANPSNLYIDFIINLFFLGTMLLVFKRNLDKEETELSKKNLELNELNETLHFQAKQLEKTNDKIENIRENLQAKVVSRTKEMDDENERLLEYAFINAHLVRAPIANILGLTQLKAGDPKVEEVKKNIEEMDTIVRKIAQVLN